MELELDRNKFEWESSRGNVIDLGFIYGKSWEQRSEFLAKMDFDYPSDRLLQFGISSGKPDASGEPCLIVKNGCATDTSYWHQNGRCCETVLGRHRWSGQFLGAIASLESPPRRGTLVPISLMERGVSGAAVLPVLARRTSGTRLPFIGS